MSYEDKTIVCVDCEQEFVHSAEDQARYAERGFTNEPKRCRDCREKRKAQSPPSRGGGGGRGSFSRDRGGQREAFEATCAECGAKTTVPFKPTTGRPVYCRDCFSSRRR